MTEIFLPSHIYKAGEIQVQLSQGGRVYFDWEKERAFLWFEDVYAPRGIVEKQRRIDIWLKDSSRLSSRSRLPLPLAQIVTIVVALVLIVLAWRLQVYETARERRAGIPPTQWLGFLKKSRDTLIEGYHMIADL